MTGDAGKQPRIVRHQLDRVFTGVSTRRSGQHYDQHIAQREECTAADPRQPGHLRP